MSEDKAKKERSPSFPFISLEKAVGRASVMYEKHKREAARLSAIAPTWNYGIKSSGLLQTVAALKQYGLVEDFGSGDDRKVQLSELGRRILIDERPGAKEAALREAAKRPRLIAEYLDRWVPDRPSDAHCISELQFDRGFTSEAARLFLKVFDDTVAYANLTGDDKLSDSPISAHSEETVVQVTVPEAYPAAPPSVALPAAPALDATDPYYFTFKPSGGFEGGFRLKTPKDFDDLIHVLTGFKNLYKPVDEIKKPEGYEDDPDFGKF